MSSVPITADRWPDRWAPLTDDLEALAFGRSVNSDVAPTVLAELRRQLSPGHPLERACLLPLGWDTRSRRDFLFLVGDSPRSFARIHFTWSAETDPRWPSFQTFRGFEDFRRSERKYQARPWEIWKWLLR